MKSVLTHTISRARRREAAAAVLDLAGRGFAIGAFVAVAALVGTRVAGFELTWVVFAVVVLAGLVSGAIRAAMDLPAAFDVALQLDRTMRLRDRLASAYALANGGAPAMQTSSRVSARSYDPDFAALVQRDGDQVASKIDVRSLAPVRIGPAWGVGGVLSVLLFLGVLYVPVVAWGDGPRADDPAAVEERERAEEERHRLHEEVAQIMDELRADDELAELPGAKEEIEALERLAEQLAQGGADPEDIRRAREETAARLNELADQLNEQARRDAESAQRLAERFAGMEAPPERPMSAQEFDDALRRGEFGSAAQTLQDRLDRADELSEEERRELAQHLRETADRVDDIAADEDAEFAERLAQMEQMLRDFGLDEDLMHDAMEGDEEAQREAMQRLRELLADEDAAERLKRDLERMHEERELQEQLKRDLEDLNEAMREAADEIDPSEFPESPESPEGDPELPEGEPGEPDRVDPEARDDAQREPGDQPQREEEQQQQQRESDDPQQQQQQEPQREEGREAGDQPQEQPAESPEGEQREEAAREAVEEGEGDEQEGVAREQELHEPGEGEQEGQEAQEQQRRSPSDVMREMEQRRQQAERRQQAAERARQRARELAEEPDRAREMQRELQRQLARDTSSEPGREAAEHARGEQQRQRDAQTEDIDARMDDDDPGRVVAEWFSDEELAADPEVRRAQVEERVRQARRIAERAVEDAAVPTRYHEFIRRYFGRFDDPQ